MATEIASFRVGRVRDYRRKPALATYGEKSFPKHAPPVTLRPLQESNLMAAS
jgi:hypothetical protein